MSKVSGVGEVKGRIKLPTLEKVAYNINPYNAGEDRPVSSSLLEYYRQTRRAGKPEAMDYLDSFEERGSGIRYASLVEYESLAEFFYMAEHASSRWLESYKSANKALDKDTQLKQQLGSPPQSRFIRDADFNDCATFEETLALGKSGWEEGVKRVHHMREELISEMGLETLDFAPTYDVAGLVVDIGRYVDGDPECMVDMPLDMTDKRTIEITVDINVACGGCVFRACGMIPIPIEATFLRGAAVSMLVEQLENLGHRVEVYAMTATSYRADTLPLLIHKIPVKKAGQFLNLSNLIFTTGHAGMVNHLEFAISEQYMDEAGTNDKKYFNSSTLTGSERRDYFSYGNRYLGDIKLVPKPFQGQVHIDNIQERGFKSKGQMTRWLFDNFQQQGIRIKE